MNKIQELNDEFRKTLSAVKGIVALTPGVRCLSDDAKMEVLRKVRTYDRFTKHNDPYEEHDMGTVNVDGKLFYFKIDYYDPEIKYHSEDPTDPKKTRRVMTIMRASEY